MTISSFTFPIKEASGIHGIIKPADKVKKMCGLTAIKTPFLSCLTAGAFSLDVKPANWKLYVEAVKPYKDVTVTNVIVEESKYTDLGEIKLTSDQH